MVGNEGRKEALLIRSRKRILKDMPFLVERSRGREVERSRGREGYGHHAPSARVSESSPTSHRRDFLVFFGYGTQDSISIEVDFVIYNNNNIGL